MAGTGKCEGGIYNTVNLHLYHYAGNNPVKYNDPDGRMAKEAAIKVILTDIATPDPTDIIPWEWVIWSFLVLLAERVGLTFRK